MRFTKARPHSGQQANPLRRRFLERLVTGLGLSSLGVAVVRAAEADKELRFPGDEPEHKVVFQFNKADADYQQHVLFSVGEMVRRYPDDIGIVVTCFGPGIHILALKPQRPVSEEVRQRVASLHEYGVRFHACNNTLKSLNWTAKDLVPFAQVVDVGAADLMELQEKRYAYISW
jgi:uncharacterized protein